MHSLSYWLKPCLLTAVYSGLISQALGAEAIVLGSDLPAYKPGQHLSTDTRIRLDPCETLIVQIEGRTVELSGRYKGKISGPNEVQSDVVCASASPSERTYAYDQYFQYVCEKKGTCDTVTLR
jgi:hypothetical protein